MHLAVAGYRQVIRGMRRIDVKGNYMIIAGTRELVGAPRHGECTYYRRSA